MPQNNQQIQFYFGTLEEYYNLSIKNPNAFYITTDTKQIFIGYDEYTSKITVENLENIDLSDTYLKKLSSNETNFIPKINSNGQLISSGFTLGQSVPANAHFLTNVEVDTLFTNATASSAGRMSASDKNKLDTIAEKTKLKSETALSEQAIIGNSLGKTYAVLTDSDGYLAVNVPWTDYNIAIASANGTGGSSGLMSAIDKEKINNLPENLKNTLVLTQSQYDALDPIDANTLYIIVG